MSGQRFTAWQLYELIEPFGERGHYWRMGQLCATVANVNRAKKTDKLYKAEDFMPRTFTQENEQSPEEMGAQVVRVFRDLADATRPQRTAS